MLLCEDLIAGVLGQFIKFMIVVNVFVRLTDLGLFRVTEFQFIMGVNSLSFSS